MIIPVTVSSFNMKGTMYFIINVFLTFLLNESLGLEIFVKVNLNLINSSPSKAASYNKMTENS